VSTDGVPVLVNEEETKETTVEEVATTQDIMEKLKVMGLDTVKRQVGVVTLEPHYFIDVIRFIS